MENTIIEKENKVKASKHVDVNSDELEVKKRYSIKKTDKQTLEKWYRLMVLGRALDDRAPNYLKQAIGWSYHAPIRWS
jgi:TPP-dependent pyruvate/acetoin dehydrogenase alpha subunit